jgi:hypothetical protein
VKDSRCLILGVASSAKGSEAGEEQGAVDHLAGGRVSVSQHSGRASTKDVGAVVARVARGARAALGSNTVEDGLHCRRSSRCRALEVP